MPKPAMESSRSGVLDGQTLRKLKQHNKNLHQQRKEAAVALRQRLEEWKREKSKEKKAEPKKPFVTTISKPVSSKPKNVTPNRTTNARKSANVASKVVSKPTLPEPAKRPSKPVAAKASLGGRKARPEENQKPGGPVRARPSAASNPPVLPKHGATVAFKAKKNRSKPHNNGSQPAAKASLGGRKVRPEKENQKPGGPVRARPSAASKAPVLPKHGATVASKAQNNRSKPHNNSSQPSASEMVTPLSARTAGFGKRHPIAYFAKGMGEGEEMVRPQSLADELKAAASSSTDTSSTQPHSAAGETFLAHGNFADITDNFSESAANNEVIHNNASLSQTKAASRDSLTKRFRKSKHLSHPAKMGSAQTTRRRSLCASHVSAVKKMPRKSMPSTRSSISNPCKSILKRKSIAVDANGASPELPVSKPRHSPSLTQDRTAPLKTQIGGEDPGQDKPHELASSGHVCFVTPPAKAESEGTHYRKTPGKVKTQEFMRSKLYDWLAAKGHTPINFRHTACFHGDGEGRHPPAPRSQIRASMSVEQLSRQEKALAKEEVLNIRKRLEWTGRKPPLTSRRSCPPLPQKTSTSTVRMVHKSTRTNLKERETNQATRKRAHQSVCFETADISEVECATTDDSVVEEERLCRERASPSSVVEDGLEPRASGQSSELSSLGSTEQLHVEYQKCLAALESGQLGVAEALEWLGMVGEASEEARHHAGWYRCRVAALKLLGDEDALLVTFEQAIIYNAQPAEEMAQLLTATMKELLSEQTTRYGTRATRSRTTEHASPINRRSRSCGQAIHPSEIRQDNAFESTVVRFSVREVTPFKKRRRTGGDAEDRLMSVVTPVRRSARLSSCCSSTGRGRRSLPAPGTPQVVEYSGLEEVPSAEKQQMLFVHNWALESVADVSLEGTGRADSPAVGKTVEALEEDAVAVFE
ncbi:hypothetical protein ACOMHN_059544 [Nucella lapillus]